MYGSKLKMGDDFILPFYLNQTDLLAGTSFEIYAPCDGMIIGMASTVQIAVTTGGPITAKVNTVAVAGLSITVADAATKGTRQIDTPTEPSDTRKFRKGDRIEVVPDAAFNTAGAVNGYLLCNTSYSQG